VLAGELDARVGDEPVGVGAARVLVQADGAADAGLSEGGGQRDLCNCKRQTCRSCKREEYQSYGSNDSASNRVVRGTGVNSERAEASLSRVTVLYGTHCVEMS